MDAVGASQRDADEAQRAAALRAEAEWQERCRRMERDDLVIVCGQSPVVGTTSISRMRIMEPTLANQHAGLEEGSQVKRQGDRLIVLRRGRLFTFAIGGGQLDSLAVTAASGVAGSDPDDRDSWYDELLVSDSTVVVLGYSRFRDDAIHVGLFDLDAAGGLRHRGTYHLRSQDFVAASNQSARLIGDRLLLTASTFLVDHPGGNWQPGMRVMQPVTPLDHNSLAHSVISCQIAPSFQCDATVVLGDTLTGYYVSPTAAYLWTSPWHRERTERSILYRIPLDGGPVTAIGAVGSPSSQLSFLEDEHQRLNVAVSNDDGVWLLRLAAASFSDGSEDAQPGDYLPLAEGRLLGAASRFIGSYVVAVVRDLSQPEASQDVVARHLDDGRLFELTLPHRIHHIEAAGNDAVIVGPGDHGFSMTALVLTPAPAVGSTLDLPPVADSELHGHESLYRTNQDGSGLLGLAVSAHQRFAGRFAPPRVVFVSKQRDTLALSGVIDTELAPDSYWDWLGDAQPIFVDDRVFALMGTELVEGRQAGGGIEVIRRVDLVTR